MEDGRYKPVFFWSLPCFSGDQKKLGGRIGVPREGLRRQSLLGGPSQGRQGVLASTLAVASVEPGLPPQAAPLGAARLRWFREVESYGT